MTPEEQEEIWNLSQIRQYRSRLNAKPIGSMIRTLMARNGYGQTQATEDMNQNWQVAVGPTLAAVSRPGAISRGVLQVFVSDSSALQELHMCKKQILEQLKASMPQAGIRDLRGRVG
jgi:predicted nucleic acid-binding Zn ribbon protein